MLFDKRQIPRSVRGDADLSFKGPGPGELRGRVAVDAVVAQIRRLFALTIPVPMYDKWGMEDTGWSSSAYSGGGWDRAEMIGNQALESGKGTAKAERLTVAGMCVGGLALVDVTER